MAAECGRMGRANTGARLLIFRRVVNSAPFNLEIGPRKRASWDPVWTPKSTAEYRRISENMREAKGGGLLIARFVRTHRH